MTPRAWCEVVLVVLAAGAGWGYVHQRDARLRAEGRLELLQIRADSTARVAAGAVREAALADTARAAAERRADTLRAAGERRAARAAAQLPAARDRVVAAAAPADTAAVRARLDELAAVYAEREAGLLDRVRADSITIAALRATHVADLAAIASLEAALAASQDAARAAAAARPGFLERVLPKAVVPLALVLGWVARGAIGG